MDAISMMRYSLLQTFMGMIVVKDLIEFFLLLTLPFPLQQKKV